MPLSPQAFYADLQATRAAAPFPMAGMQFDRLAMGISTAVASWAIGQPNNVALRGTASGSAGAGTIPAGRFVVPPNPPLVTASLTAVGMTGPLSVALGTIVGQAIPRTFSTLGGYVGVSPGVAVGADATKVIVANGPSLIAILQGALASFSGPGSAMPQMASGLGTGIASCVKLGFGTGTVVGSPGPSPAVTTTTSVVV